MKADIIAIDGPSASGKSTVARGVAEALKRLYVDSGALYRAVAWKALRDDVDVRESAAVAALVQAAQPAFFVDAGAVRFRLDGVVLDRELRTEVINRRVSSVAATPAVREQVTQWLRDMLSLGSLVMEGRDIGTAVFPDARHKFYLDASPVERARRRHAEMAPVESALSVDDVRDSLSQRDSLDSQRKTAPLKVADDAIIIDSTSLSAEAVVVRVLAHVRE